MMYRILLGTLIICLFDTTFVVGQSSNSCKPETNLIKDVLKCNKIYATLSEFLIEKNHVPSNENYPFYHFNIYNGHEFDISENYGIYIFGIKSSHPIYYLYFKYADGTIEIQEDSSIDNLLPKLSNFFIKNNIENEAEKVQFLYGVLTYLSDINNYPIDKKRLHWDRE